MSLWIGSSWIGFLVGFMWFGSLGAGPRYVHVQHTFKLLESWMGHGLRSFQSDSGHGD